MEADSSIEIVPVANGFIVMGRRGHHEMMCERQTLVFQSMNGLVDWMRKHFTHRDGEVCCDLIE